MDTCESSQLISYLSNKPARNKAPQVRAYQTSHVFIQMKCFAYILSAQLKPAEGEKDLQRQDDTTANFIASKIHK